MPLADKDWKLNLRSFLWHSSFFALVSNFIDIDTVIPSMLIKAGGTAFHLGLLTAIMLGGSEIFQLVFSSFLSRFRRKKRWLLLGINIRVVTLLSLGALLLHAQDLPGEAVILLIFGLITIFSMSGAFAGISYVDILGKSIRPEKRKFFFSIKQIITSVGVFASAAVVRELLKYFEYPQNYSLLFIIAGFLLFGGSLGFWRLKEPESKEQPPIKFKEFLLRVPAEVRKNPNLLNYLLILNTLGLGLSILPFAVLSAKEQFGLGYDLIGNFLLLRTVGMLIAGITLFRLAHRFSYKHLLKFALVVGSMVPVLAIVFRDSPVFFQSIFLFAGIFVASYKTAVGGILLEISNNENRALYTGISGAGKIVLTLFPITAGALLPLIGFNILFGAITVVMLSSIFFVQRLDCNT